MTAYELLEMLPADKVTAVIDLIEAIKEPYELQIKKLSEDNYNLKQAIDAYRKTGYEPWEFNLITYYKKHCEQLEHDRLVLISKIEQLKDKPDTNTE